MKTAEIIEYLADCLAEDVASSAQSDLPDFLYSASRDGKPWPERAHRWCLALMRAQFHGEHDTVQALQESGHSAVAMAEKTLPADPRGVLAAAWERHCVARKLRRSKKEADRG